MSTDEGASRHQQQHVPSSSSSIISATNPRSTVQAAASFLSGPMFSRLITFQLKAGTMCRNKATSMTVSMATAASMGGMSEDRRPGRRRRAARRSCRTQALLSKLAEKCGAYWLQKRKYGAFYELALFQYCPPSTLFCTKRSPELLQQGNRAGLSAMADMDVLVAGAALLGRFRRILSSPTPLLPASKPSLPTPLGYRRSRNAFLVLAHPDDESMFFTPTILFLKSKGHNIHVLCMSLQDCTPCCNADGLGDTQKKNCMMHVQLLRFQLSKSQSWTIKSCRMGFMRNGIMDY
ncbi:hypothetical protein ZWY2020_012042 [Hordeum vulgare]|nr:hypothetical protein ZWY2020_012042 [Hordeum vulgare]